MTSKKAKPPDTTTMKLSDDERSWIHVQRAQQDLRDGSPSLHIVIMNIDRAIRDLAVLGRTCSPKSVKWDTIIDLLN